MSFCSDEGCDGRVSMGRYYISVTLAVLLISFWVFFFVNFFPSLLPESLHAIHLGQLTYSQLSVLICFFPFACILFPWVSARSAVDAKPLTRGDYTRKESLSFSFRVK